MSDTNTVTLYKCGNCETIITNPKDGIVIHGNVYVADPGVNSGLIGNNFPEEYDVAKGASISDQIGESVYCATCFLKIVFPGHRFSQTRGLS